MGWVICLRSRSARCPPYCPAMGIAESMRPSIEAELRRLVDDYRTRCLWFLRPDYYPKTREEMLRVLRQIEKNADREGFVRAARIRQWLSPPSSGPSAVS